MTLPGTRPARRVHVPAPPSGQLPEPGGRTPAERAYRRQQQVASTFNAYRASIPDGVDPDELANAKGVFAVSDPALTLQPALDEARADAENATSRVGELVKGARVGSDVGSQIAAQRYWSRAQRGLDAARAKGPGPAVAAAQRLIADADDSQVNVLAEEVGAWLADNNLPAEWLPNALANRIPGLSDAAADATLKQKQLAQLAQNHGMLQRSFANDVAPQALLDPANVSVEPYTGG